jgi:hypothetical protein
MCQTLVDYQVERDASRPDLNRTQQIRLTLKLKTNSQFAQIHGDIVSPIPKGLIGNRALPGTSYPRNPEKGSLGSMRMGSFFGNAFPA